MQNRSVKFACPIIDGEKWSATEWLHVRAFSVSSRTSSDCVDENLNCTNWADLGECEINPLYMVGSISRVQVIVGRAAKCAHLSNGYYEEIKIYIALK
ncbi:hypothetical protein CASFOL_018907 [Castilleja foliolosa]|uniref:procollagen-proline 4-dioxygenase n=1 Tax=Castilleja foliolosa TaxID=1961234 RepID=A0ABD3D2X8_9LAMI